MLKNELDIKHKKCHKKTHHSGKMEARKVVSVAIIGLGPSKCGSLHMEVLIFLCVYKLWLLKLDRNGELWVHEFCSWLNLGW
jgi:hypothetical protein